MDDLTSYGDDLDDAAIKELIARHTRATVTLRRCLNNRQPISSLPSEILVTIFRDAGYNLDLSMGGYNFNSFEAGRTNLCAIARTCFSWNALISNNPVFWVDISVQMPVDVIQNALERSRPLTINLHVFQEVEDRWLSKEYEFWKVVEPHLTRCKGFVCDDRKKTIRKVQLHMPALVSLYIGEPGPVVFSYSPSIFDPLPGFAPMLESLRISYALYVGKSTLAF